MALQDAVSVTLTRAAQTTWGTPAATGDTAKRTRRVSSTLGPSKDVFVSNEVRDDMQTSDVRHGGQRVDGVISCELSTESYDDLFEALMRNTWASPVTSTQSDFTSLAVVSGVITAGSGSFITKGFKVGDIVQAGSLSESANNGVPVRITALTATTMTTYPALTDMSADTSFSLDVVGKKLTMGTAKHLFTIEQNFPDINVSEVFDSCRIAGASLRLPPVGNATMDFQVMGRRTQIKTSGSAPYFTSVTAAPTTGLLTGIDGGVRLGGAEVAVLTGLDLQMALNMSSGPVVGSAYAPNLFYGRFVFNGTVSFYLEDATYMNAFLNEDELDLVAKAPDADGGFLCFNMQRIKLLGASKQIAGDGGVMITSPFQGLRKAGGSGAAYDTGMLTLQRSNS